MSRPSINDVNNRTRAGRSSYAPSQGFSYGTPRRGPIYGNRVADYEPDAQSYHEAANKSRNSGRRGLIIALCVLLALVLGCGCAFAAYMSSISKKLNQGDKSAGELSAISDALGGYQSNLDEPFYMLLLGSDARSEDDFSRTDTNVVVRVDPITYTVSMVSIPRDTKIEIEGHGTQKFNAAYAFGKVPGVIEAAESLLDIEITHYAEVSFLDLKDLVDAVGGVTVYNESRIDNPKCDDGDGNHYIIEEGEVTLNGGEALTYARNRDYPMGDFTRTQHQRQLVEAIVDEVLSASITSIPGIIEAAAESVTTDLNVFDLIGLAQQFADADDITMYSGMLPSYTQSINGISFVINDEEKTAEMMELFEAGEDFSDIVSTKTASDITTSAIDTSNTLLTSDDDEVVSGSAKANSPASSGSGSYSGSGTTGGSTSSGGSDAPASGESGSGSSSGGTSSSGSGGTASGGSTSGGGSGGESSGGSESGSSSGSGSGAGSGGGASGGSEGSGSSAD